MILKNPVYPLAFRACELTGISEELVFSKCKRRRVHQIRFAVWHIVRKRGGVSYPEMAIPFDTDHGAAMNGVRKAPHLLETDKWFCELVRELENETSPSVDAKGKPMP